MSPEEHGTALARALPPITDEQVEETARILASVEPEQVAA
jgi:hypothetical protein